MNVYNQYNRLYFLYSLQFFFINSSTNFLSNIFNDKETELKKFCKYIMIIYCTVETLISFFFL
jgi:hypothetical protein